MAHRWRRANSATAIIAPLAYHLRKESKLLYRDPAYLVCTDPALDRREIIEAYFQRWDIEVNFRDEKTLLGVGQAQVRHPSSVESAPALTVASYAVLLVSAQRAFGISHDGLIPQPKWVSSNHNDTCVSTQQLIHQIRAEVWAEVLVWIVSPASSLTRRPTRSLRKCSFPLQSAVFYANG